MARNLTDQVRSIASVTTAVARGDLSKTVDVNVEGEMAELKSTVNSMVAQVSIYLALLDSCFSCYI
jgi:osomolarity two-component system sensor histidine kinase NIK1